MNNPRQYQNIFRRSSRLLCCVLLGAALLGGCRSEVAKKKTVVVPRDTVVKKSLYDTTFDARGVTPEGDMRDTLIVSKRKVQATEYHALLPFVFFDKDSAVIPDRYVRIEKKKRKAYQIGKIPHGNTMTAYYHILNVIGSRLKENPRAGIVVTGCRSQFETRDSTLTKRRADAVKLYLTDVWRISPKRITTVASGLPALASLSEVDTLLGAEENQRVEIASDDTSILAPIALPDTATLQPVGLVRFFPPQTSDSTADIPDSWALNIAIGDSVLTSAVTGTGSPPTRIDFPIDGMPDLKGKSSIPISSTIVVMDTSDKELGKAPSRKVFIREIGVFEEQIPVVNNHYIHRFNFMLFGFDSASVFDFSKQAVNIVSQRITPNSTVRITGHTDKTGLPYYNMRLSVRRAEFVRDLLGVKAQISGTGETERMYDQKLPEGRYYSRTVTIDIETPVEPGADNGSPPPKPPANPKPKPRAKRTDDSGNPPQ